MELVSGKDITIIASGATVFHAVDAAAALKAQGINAGVLNVHTIKPLDAAAVKKAVDTTGLILTVEDHNIIGGLGSAVAEVLAEYGKGRLVRHGLKDSFGESGTPEELYRKYKLDSAGIIEVVKEVLK